MKQTLPESTTDVSDKIEYSYSRSVIYKVHYFSCFSRLLVLLPDGIEVGL